MRAQSVVKVESACGMWDPRMGSGVIISRRHVLTAAHIVSCARIPLVRVTYVDTHGRERRMRMVVTEEDSETNVAKLEIASAETFALRIAPPLVRSPDPGDAVCASLAATGAPACGKVASKWSVVRSMTTRSHDVGAPVYCANGNLVGIVTNRGPQGEMPYTWIAPIDKHWLDGIVLEENAPTERVTEVRTLPTPARRAAVQ